MDSKSHSNITEKLIHLNLADNLIEDLDVKVTKRCIRAVKSHWHDFYEMELILDGDTKTEINGKVYDLPQGSMALVTPSDVHSYFDMGRDIEVLNLVFASKSLEYNSFASSVLSGDSIVCKLPPKVFESMIFMINKISEESRSSRLLNKRYISNLLSCLIIELKRIKKEEGISKDEDDFNTVRKAIVFIRNHFKEPLTLEDVLSIYKKEQPLGVIAQFGGQTPLNLSADLEKYGVKILGTSPAVIDMAEDRDLFRAMMEKLEIPMPESGMAVTVDDAIRIANNIGYPVMVRPSYVLGGRGMEVVYDDESMAEYMKAAVGVTPDRPILIDRFLNHALECEADAISDGTHAFVPAVMEHIELAGVHSGDSACIIPSVHISEENVKTIKEYTRKIAEEMHVKGLMNMQYAIEKGKVFVLEANPRASRTVPLVSKVCNIRMVPLATDIITSEITGRPSPVPALKEQNIPYHGVKEAVFPFNMFQEVDPVLGPEMRSTGEVLGLSVSCGEAFFKAQEAVQSKLPLEGTVLISVNNKDKDEVVEVAKSLVGDGFKIVATSGTFAYLTAAGVPAVKANKLYEGRPDISDMIANGEIQLIVNSPIGKSGVQDDSYLRKAAIKAKVPYITTVAAAKATAEGIHYVKTHKMEELKSLQELHSEITDL